MKDDQAKIQDIVRNMKQKLNQCRKVVDKGLQLLSERRELRLAAKGEYKEDCELHEVLR